MNSIEEQELINVIEQKLAEWFQQIKEDLTKTVSDYLDVVEYAFDVNNIKWVRVNGFSGPYERYPAKGERVELTPDYKALLKWLKEHNGKATYEGYFYWLFQDGATIGRKKRK